MNQQPTSIPPTTIQQAGKSKKVTWAIACLVGPILTIALSILAYATLNFITGMTALEIDSQSSAFSNPSPVRTIANVILFILGSIAAIALVPGVIAGIILLITRKK